MKFLLYSALVFGKEIGRIRRNEVGRADKMIETTQIVSMDRQFLDFSTALFTTQDSRLQKRNADEATDIYFFIYEFGDSDLLKDINGRYTFFYDETSTDKTSTALMKNANDPTIQVALNDTFIEFFQFQDNDGDESRQTILEGQLPNKNHFEERISLAKVNGNNGTRDIGIGFAWNEENYQYLQDIPFYMNIDVKYDELASNVRIQELLSGEYYLESLIYGSPSYLKSNSNKSEPAIYFWSSGEKWAFTTFASFVAKMPAGYVYLKAYESDPLFLPSNGWIDNHGNDVEVHIHLDEKSPSADLAGPEFIYLDIGIDEYGWKKSHLIEFHGEYEYDGRLNNAPIYKKTSIDGNQLLFVAFVLEKWFICRGFKDNFDLENCPIEIELPEVIADWFNVFNSKKYPIIIGGEDELSNKDEVTILTDKIEFEGIEVCLQFKSDDSLWHWSGDDVIARHHASTGQIKSSKVVLEYQSMDQTSCFEKFKPGDRIDLINGGDNGVFIKEMLLDGNKINVHGSTSFWIDGDKINCDGTISVSQINIQNGMVVWNSCSEPE